MYIDTDDLWGLLKLLFVLALCVLGIHSCVNADWYKASQAADAAQERANETPHVIRTSPDGCKVYAFKDGDYHYFTRCSDGSVTTDRNYTVSHGKTTEHKTETIVTQGNS